MYIYIYIYIHIIAILVIILLMIILLLLVILTAPAWHQCDRLPLGGLDFEGRHEGPTKNNYEAHTTVPPSKVVLIHDETVLICMISSGSRQRDGNRIRRMSALSSGFCIRKPLPAKSVSQPSPLRVASLQGFKAAPVFILRPSCLFHCPTEGYAKRGSNRQITNTSLLSHF